MKWRKSELPRGPKIHCVSSLKMCINNILTFILLKGHGQNLRNTIRSDIKLHFKKLCNFQIMRF